MTQLNQENLKKLETLFKMMTESLTKDDFVKAFEALTKVVLQTEKNLIEKIDKKMSFEIDTLNELKTTYSEAIKQAKETNNSLSGLRKWALEQIGTIFLKNKINEKMDKMYAEHETAMSKMYQEHEAMISKMDMRIAEIPTETELLALVKPFIPLPVKGDKGNDGVIEDIKDIREDIKELKEDMKKQKSRVMGGGIMGRDLVKEKDISNSLDGSTKTFNIPAFYSIISIDLSSFPYGALRKNVDYTYNGNVGTITFTDTIDAASQLKNGQSCIITFIAA